MTDGSIEPVVDALVTLVEPSSVVAVCPGAQTWADAFAQHDVAKTSGLEPDVRPPFTVNERSDLVVSIDVGDRVPADVAPLLVASLCAAGEVVAFAAALPGLAADAVNLRWPAWWDSLFEVHGYIPFDLVRPRLWNDDRVDIAVRQSVVLYAPSGRFTSVDLPSSIARSVVHPEAHQRALDVARERHDEHDELIARANDRVNDLEAEISALAWRAERLDEQLRVAQLRLPDRGPEIEGLSVLESQLVWAEGDARDAHADAAQLWLAVGVLQREATALAPPPAKLARRVLNRLAFRTAFRRVLGPPAPLFDAHYYLWRHPDVANSSLPPLWHYRRHGAREDRSPHPFVEPRWYRERYPDVGKSEVPALHYLRGGWRDGSDPHPLFSGEWYATQTSLANWNRSPLEHYLAHGAEEGLSPHPLIDGAWYRAQNPDVARAGVDAVAHFLTRGWWEGRSPHPLFDLRWYLATHHGVASFALNPLLDYLDEGWTVGRDPHPLFDTKWYLETYADVKAAGVDPLTHFVLHGAGEGRSPGPLFDTQFYVEQHPEAAAGGRNPLEFFTTVGADRGDVPSAAAAGFGESDERLGM